MLNGDISNHRSYVIGVRCEDCLLKYRNEGIKDKLMNVVKGKSHNAEVNHEVLSLMNHIYWNTEMTVSLIVDKENYTEELKDVVADFPFNEVGVVITNISEITMMLNTGQLAYYIDLDYNRLASVNSRHAVDLKTFNSILKRGGHTF